MERRGGWNRGRQSDNTRRILELRRSGKSFKQIADIVGCAESHCGKVCRSAGLGGSTIEQRLTESQVADIVSRSGFDYVGGYQSQRGPIVVRCRQCGRSFERQFHIFRDVVNGTWKNANECPLCRTDQKAERDRKKREAAECEARTKAERRAEKQADLISRQTEERLAIHICKNCGKEYCIGSTGYNSRQYCSEKCMKRWLMRIKNDRRLRRLKAREHDTDITLEKLFRRDGGVCYICGCSCDWSDVVEKDGTMIAGDHYPSIDHVKPVAKGGTHTWNNIRLACRACNTLKGSS